MLAALTAYATEEAEKAAGHLVKWPNPNPNPNANANPNPNQAGGVEVWQLQHE